MEWTPQIVEFTVAGNQYSGTVQISGQVRSIVVMPPTSGSYDITLASSQGDYVVAESSLNGQQKVVVNDSVHGNYTLSVLNAPNGAWKLKITWEQF